MNLTRKSTVFCVVILIVLSGVRGQGQTAYQWVQKADYGGGEIYDPFSFTINGIGYVGTGQKLNPNIRSKEFWAYDPVADTWTQKADFLGTGRYGAKAFVVNGVGYAGTGFTSIVKDDFYAYEPLINTWTQVADFPGGSRYTAIAFALNNRGYLGLGYPCDNALWQFNPVTNSWIQVSSFPGAVRQAPVGFVIGDYAYVGMGLCSGTNYNDFFRYDPFNDTWTPIAAFPGLGRNAASSFVIDSIGYVGLGYDYDNSSSPYSLFNDFWKYNPVINQWTQLPDFPGGARFTAVGFSIGNKGYFGMGSDTILLTRYSNKFWCYQPVSTSVEELAFSQISIVFDPITSEIVIAGVENPLHVALYSVNGAVLYEVLLESNERNVIPVNALNKGVYLVKLIDQKSGAATGKKIVLM